MADDDLMAVSNDMSRRALLQKAAAGAGAAGALWVAPSLLTLDSAVAAGTCPGLSLTFPWSTGGACVTHTNATNPLVGNIGGVSGVDVRIVGTAQSGLPSSGNYRDNWMTRAAAGTPCTSATDACGTGPCGTSDATRWVPRGANYSFYALTMAPSTSGNPVTATCNGAGTAGRYSQVTFGFFDAGTTNPRTVRNLSFSLHDVDFSTGNYRDRVYVAIDNSTTAGVGQANPQANAATTGVGGTFTVSGLGANVTQIIAGRAVFQGTASTAACSTASSVTLTSNANVNIRTVTVRFRDQLGNTNGDINSGGSSAPQTIQWIGIGNLSFCRVYPTNP